MSLGIQAYTQHSLEQRVHFKVECIASVYNFLLVGTTDGKLVVYEFEEKDSGEWDVALLSTHLAQIKKPIRALAPLPDLGMVLGLCGSDMLVVYELRLAIDREEIGPHGAQDLTPELSSLKLPKEVVTFSVRKWTGAFTVAVLLHRQLLLYEYVSETKTLARVGGEGLKLSDKASAVVWGGKETLLIAFRRGYWLYDVPTASVMEHAYVPDKVQISFLESMHPVLEVLVAIDDARLQRTLPDGNPVAGGTLVLGKSCPAAVVYDHPYVLCVYQRGEPQLQIYLPWINTLASSQRPATACCQVLSATALRLPRRHVVDFDRPFSPTGSKSVGQGWAQRHPDRIWFLGPNHSIHFLMRQPMSRCVEDCCNRDLLSVAVILCQRCREAVDTELRERVLMRQAIVDFFAGNHAEALHTIVQTTTHAHFAMLLYPDLLPPTLRTKFLHVIHEDVRLELQRVLALHPDHESNEDALRCLVGFLFPLRPQCIERTHGLVPPVGKGEIDLADLLKGLDTCLLRALALLKLEDALIDFLQQPNSCAIAEAQAFLMAQHMYVPLAVWCKALAQHSQALAWLQARCVGGASPSPEALCRSLPLKVFGVLEQGYVAKGGAALYGRFQCVSFLREHLAHAPDAEPEVVEKAVVSITLANYVATLSLDPVDGESDLIWTYGPWLLRNLPTSLSLAVFRSSRNGASYYPDAVRLIESRETLECAGIVDPLLVMVDFLENVFLDTSAPPIDGDVPQLHAIYWKSLASLVLREGTDPDTSRSATARREKLHSFLRESEFIDCAAAREFFEREELKANSFPERAIVYARLNDHERALEMYLGEGRRCLQEAQAYVTRVAPGLRPNVLKRLLEKLLRPTDGTSPQMEEVVQVLNHCRGVDAFSALSMLPDSTPLGDLAPFLIRSLTSIATREREEEIHREMVKSEAFKMQQAVFDEESRFVKLVDGTFCAVCGKRIELEQSFVYYPNAVVAHEGCIEDTHICPVSHIDFRKDFLSVLHSI